MEIKHILQECVPTAYYSDGTEAKCWIYKICDMFDINSQSFKQAESKDDMNKKNKELNLVPVWGPEFNSRTGKSIQS